MGAEAAGRRGGRAQAAGARSLRGQALVRMFFAFALVHPGPTRLFPVARAQQAPAIEVSANPVTSGTVTLRWPAAAGTAHIEIFSLVGTRIAGADLPGDPGRWLWDLTTSTGAPVANGAYFIVVTTGDNTRLRRRLLVAR